MPKPTINKLYLNQTGLAIFLGGKTQELVYRAVLDKAGSVKSIRAYVNERLDTPLAYTTVATIANKLCQKGILARENTNQYKPNYCYTALVNEQELIEYGIQLLIEKLLLEYPGLFNAILSNGI